MFKIGEFSSLSGVTVKALRYYDRVDLLKPAQVDPFTGYRYYTIEQIDRLNRIIALKDLGLSLDEVSRVLCENPPLTEIRGMLRLKRAQLRQTIAEESARLERVEARLRLLEHAGEMPAHEVVMRDVAEQHVLSYREILATPRDIAPLFMRVMGAIHSSRVEVIAPPMALYHHGEYREHDLDVEITVPVPKDTPSSLPLGGGHEMCTRTLSGGRMASTLCHMESQTDIYIANRDLGNWIVENGYRLGEGPCREVYADPVCPGKLIIFEVQLPLEC
jgi:DNA-binding transcriptional MerR regulator